MIKKVYLILRFLLNRVLEAFVEILFKDSSS